MSAIPYSQLSLTDKRRRFIVESLMRDHELPLAKIFEEFPKTANQSVKDDIEHLVRIGLRIVRKRIGREVILVDDASVHNDVKDVRADVRTFEKKLVAQLTMDLVCGGPFLRYSHDDTASGRSPSAPHKSSVIHKLLEKCARIDRNCRQGVDRMHRLFEDLWSEQNRQIFLDSGTTNERIADLLVDLRLPLQDGNLSRLTVTTNDTSIFYKIGNPRCPVGSIVVGGQKRGRSDTIAGALSENFLRNARLHFSASVIGATVIDLGSWHACSDTQEEANLKSIIFETSSLRIVCVDSSKFSFRPMRTSFPFASLQPEQIDLIITNCPSAEVTDEDATPADKEAHARAILEFPNQIRAIIKRGIPVLLAESHETEAIDSLFDPSTKVHAG